MRIERKKSNLVEFSSLKIGDVFEEDGYTLIKSECIVDRGANNDEYNCLSLDDGYLHHCEPTDKVKHRPDAKLVLED